MAHFAPSAKKRAANNWPALLLWRLILVMVLYLAYLPFCGYRAGHMRYDAGQYWELATRFFRGGHFSLLHYDSSLRGYAGPLLLLPAWALRHLTGWLPLTCTGITGAGWAAVLFGWLLPAGWERTTGQRLSAGRWALVVALGFLCWRDHFIFPLMDVPACVLFGGGLLALWSPRALVWGAAGLALGAALNVRPSYMISLPAALLLGWHLSRSSPGAAQRWSALAAGMAIVLLPQMLINLKYYQQPTPLVLWDQTDPRPLYLRALGWGTRVERYETGFFLHDARILVVPDAEGIEQMRKYGPAGFPSYGQYFAFVAQHPLPVVTRYLRHFYNSFDLWYATPYPLQARPPGQLALQMFNHAALGLGLLALWRLPRRHSRAAQLVLLAFGLQVLLTVPFHVETRYALPVHLILLLAATDSSGWAALRASRQWAVWALGAVLWLAGCAYLTSTEIKRAEFDRFDLET